MGRLAGRPGLSIATPVPEDSAADATARGADGEPASRRASTGPRGRWGRAVALGTSLLLAVLAALVLGVTTASVQQSLGPHVARYSVTTDDLVTVDLGPLGSVEIDSPLPLTLGVEVVVQEIPRTVTAVDPARTVQVLGQDLDSYVQFFTGPQATIADAARALTVDAVRRTVGALLVLALVGAGGRAVLGPARRREMASALAPHGGQVARATTTVAAVVVLCVSSAPDVLAEEPRGRPSAVFDGTPLAGARITGRLAGVVDTYGSLVVDAYRENEAFYRAAQDAVAAAWDQRARATTAREESAARLRALVEGPADVRAPDPVTPRVPTLGGDAVEPVVIVVVSDLHCNVGMARVIGTVVERSGADLVLNAGDTTVNGTSVERYCVTTFARAVPRGVPTVVSDGNHDSLATAEHERGAGWTVLDGGVVEVAGVRVLGDRDPHQTQIGGGTAQVSDESAAESGARLARTACDDGAVDLLLIHTPAVGDEALGSGCVPVQISGHEHRRSGPVRVGEGVRYVSSTTAGATSGGATVGPLNGVASLTVLRFDPVGRRLLDLQVVDVAPDGTATVGPREPWPSPVADGGAGEGGAGEPTEGPRPFGDEGPVPTED